MTGMELRGAKEAPPKALEYRAHVSQQTIDGLRAAGSSFDARMHELCMLASTAAVEVEYDHHECE